MRKKLAIAIVVAIFAITGCATVPATKIDKENYLGYQPIDPVPVSTVTVFDEETNNEKEIFWESLSDAESKRRLLPLQSAEVSVIKTDASGKASYLGASVSAEKGSYKVIMDYMKYRVEDVFDGSRNYIGSGRIGVGLRIKALVVTNKANLNLGGITAIGLEASRDNLSGGISVDVVGIDSSDVTNLIPLTSEIDQTSIQSALQALASIKSKLWEQDTRITPHLLAFRQDKPNKESEIRKQVSTYLKTASSELLKKYWKPDGKTTNKKNEKNLKNWMASNGLDTGPGSITMFLYGSEYESLREKAVRELKLKQ